MFKANINSLNNKTNGKINYIIYITNINII